jgi:membrane associated rhomboid family serine protease
MDKAITITRVIMAIIGVILFVVFYCAAIVIETLAVIISLPVASVILDRQEIKLSWIGTYSNVVSHMNIVDIIKNIIWWSTADDSAEDSAKDSEEDSLDKYKL